MSEDAGYAPIAAGRSLAPLAKTLLDTAAPFAVEIYPEEQRERGRVSLCLQAIVAAGSNDGLVDGLLCDAISETIASFVTQTANPEAAFVEVVNNARSMALMLIESGVVGRPRSVQ